MKILSYRELDLGEYFVSRILSSQGDLILELDEVNNKGNGWIKIKIRASDLKNINQILQRGSIEK